MPRAPHGFDTSLGAQESFAEIRTSLDPQLKETGGPRVWKGKNDSVEGEEACKRVPASAREGERRKEVGSFWYLVCRIDLEHGKAR